MKKIVIEVIFSLLAAGSFAQTEGDVFFAAPVVHDIEMTITQPNYWDSLVAYKPLGQYLRAGITIDGVSYSDVGIKFKGNSSYSNPSDKKPFKISLNEFISGQDVDGLSKFNLNNGFKDPSFLREKLALDFYRAHGLAAPRCAYARVYINGVYWGLYTFVEEVTKTFLDDPDHFGNKQGNLFKGDPSGDLKWLGSADSLYYPKYELNTNTTVNDWSDLVRLINNINNSGANFHDSLEAVLNTTEFIKQWAALNMFVNLDSYIGSGHNYFIYDDTVTSKFRWIAWDVNESFGNFGMGMTPTQLKNLTMFYVTSPAASRPLVQKMLTDNAYRAELVSTICQWVEYDFSNAALDSKIDSLVNAITADVYADTKKFYSNAEFDANINSDITPTSGPPGTIMGVKSFITARRSALTAELATNGCNVGVAEATENPGPDIFPNPANDELHIRPTSNLRDQPYSIYSATGALLYSGMLTGSEVVVNMSGFAPGIYFLRTAGSGFRFQVIH